MWQDLGTAIAMVMIIEGLMPFMSPDSMRQMMKKMSQFDDQTLRFIGLTSMVIGLILLNILR